MCIRDRRDGEALDRQVTEFEARAGLELLHLWYSAIPIDQRGSSFGQEYGDFQAAGEGGQAGDVVGVLMGDEDGVDAGGVFADGGEA